MAQKKTAKKRTTKKRATKKRATKKVAKKKAYDFKDPKLTAPLLIERWTGVSNGHDNFKNQMFWREEATHFKRLAAAYPHRFLETLEMPFKLGSLKVLYSEFFRNFLREEYWKYQFAKKHKNDFKKKEKAFEENFDATKKKIKQKKSIRRFTRKNNGKN